MVGSYLAGRSFLGGDDSRLRARRQRRARPGRLHGRRGPARRSAVQPSPRDRQLSSRGTGKPISINSFNPRIKPCHLQSPLSGLNAAQSDLNVTANNIANTRTTGFKGSRAEFADLFAVAAGRVSNADRQRRACRSRSRSSSRRATSNSPTAPRSRDQRPGLLHRERRRRAAYTRAGAFQSTATASS